MPQVSVNKSPPTVAQIGSSRSRAATVRPTTSLPSMAKHASTKTLVPKPQPRKPCPRPRGSQLVARAPIPQPMVFTPSQQTLVFKPRNATAAKPNPGNRSLVQQQNLAALVRGSHLSLHPTRGTLPPMRPVLQYRKVSSQNMLPTSSSATQLSR